MSERLRSSASVKDMAYRLVPESDVLEAAAELDRREAIVAAAEALRDAHLAHIRASGRIPELQDARNCAFESLLALLPAAALKG